MDADKAVLAVFEQSTHTLTIAVNGTGTVEPAEGTHNYANGAYVEITATPGDGFEFQAWQGAARGTENPYIMRIDADATVTAVFKQITHTLTIWANGAGRVVPAEGTHDYSHGEQIEIAAIPDDGYEFVEWQGSVRGSQNPVFVAMDADFTVTAVFIEDPKGYLLCSPVGGAASKRYSAYGDFAVAGLVFAGLLLLGKRRRRTNGV